MGYIAKLIETANDFTRTAFKQIEFSKKIVGTTVQVTRSPQDSKYKKVYGSLYQSDLVGSGDPPSSFEYVVLINMNDMRKLHQRAIDTLEFYDTQNKLMQGDTISYQRKGRRYSFKVTGVETWSDDIDVLYKYTITPLTDIATGQNEKC